MCPARPRPGRGGPLSDMPASPSASRLSAPGWLDGRLVLGVLLVLVSVVVGARVLSSADRSTLVWAAATDLSAGAALTSADVEPVRVRLLDGLADRYVPQQQDLVGQVLERPSRAASCAAQRAARGRPGRADPPGHRAGRRRPLPAGPGPRPAGRRLAHPRVRARARRGRGGGDPSGRPDCPAEPAGRPGSRHDDPGGRRAAADRRAAGAAPRHPGPGPRPRRQLLRRLDQPSGGPAGPSRGRGAPGVGDVAGTARPGARAGARPSGRARCG